MKLREQLHELYLFERGQGNLADVTMVDRGEVVRRVTAPTPEDAEEVAAFLRGIESSIRGQGYDPAEDVREATNFIRDLRGEPWLDDEDEEF